MPILNKHLIRYPDFLNVVTNLISKNRFFLEELSKIRICNYYYI